MEPATTDPKCFKLALSVDEISALRRLVDESLQIPQARALERQMGDNKEQALSVLTGKPVIRDKHVPGNVVKRINLGIKKKAARACQWPSRAEDRAKVNARTAERRSKGLLSPFASGRLSKDGRAYLPSLKEQKLLNSLRKNISDQLAIDPTDLSVPKAVVSCIANDTESARQLHKQTGVCVQVSMKHGCNMVEVVQAAGTQLVAVCVVGTHWHLMHLWGTECLLGICVVT